MIDLKKRSQPTAEVFTSAMNDIMFFLMLFFIIISTLLNPNMIKVHLPSSQNSQTVHKKEINITITGEHKYYINNAEVSFDQLEPALQTEVAKDQAAAIVLRIDKTLNIQELVDVLSIGSKLNLKMTIATTK
jgi:biopolymer transport protein ExbD